MPKLSDLVSKITYNHKCSDELLKAIVQNTKNNRGLKLILTQATWKPYSEKKIEGILKRQAKIKKKESK